MSDVTEKVQEVVADAADEVAEQAADFAEFARKLSKAKLQYATLGAIFGGTAAAVTAWTIAYKKAVREANARADDEIEEMRAHYRSKGVALEQERSKGDLAELVRERRYTTPEPETSTSPPMAVQPPSSIIEPEDDAAGEPSDEGMAVNDVEGTHGLKERGEEVVRNVFREARAALPQWNIAEERARRSPDRPYVIHRDEVHETPGYSEVTLTYYQADDVLADEQDEPMDPDRRDNTVGEANLDRFGHGSGDPNIVYVRNDNLEILYEIVFSKNSFAQEVHGFDPPEKSIRHGGYDSGNLERMRRRERDGEQ